MLRPYVVESKQIGRNASRSFASLFTYSSSSSLKTAGTNRNSTRSMLPWIGNRSFILAVLLSLAILSNISFFERRLDAMVQQQPIIAAHAPTMYTFYSEIQNVPMPAGMAHTDHSRLLKYWIRAWRQAGWNPVVLDEEDAMKHPEYNQMKALVEQTGAGAYNQLCFLRWLALAQSGGGWMSDYDVFPLHDFRNEGNVKDLPNNGTLTLHNRLCPSLVSGSGEEWFRVAKEMIECAAEQTINSDQKALVALSKQQRALFEQDWSVTQTVFNATLWNEGDCSEHTPQSMRAVHFAHAPIKKAIREGSLPVGWTIRNRAEVATNFMSQWLQHCGQRKLFRRDADLLTASRGIGGANKAQVLSKQPYSPPDAINTTGVDHVSTSAHEIRRAARTVNKAATVSANLPTFAKFVANTAQAVVPSAAEMPKHISSEVASKTETSSASGYSNGATAVAASTSRLSAAHERVAAFQSHATAPYHFQKTKAATRRYARRLAWW